MPPSLREWLPEGHLAWFVLAAVEEMDLSGFYGVYRFDGHGRPAYGPAMMVALLQRLIDTETRAPVDERRFGEAGELLVRHLESLGRKRSTVEEYRSYLNVHLAPFFGATSLDKVTTARIEAFIAAKRKEVPAFVASVGRTDRPAGVQSSPPTCPTAAP